MRLRILTGLAAATLIAVVPMHAAPPAQPPSSHMNQDAVESLTADMAGALGSSEYWFIPAGSTLQEGVALDWRTGQLVTAGEDLPAPGVYWLPYGGKIEGVEVDPNVVVGAMADVSVSGPMVSCRSGWFACCYCHATSHRPVARCRRNAAADSDCQAGGNGAMECSITKSDCDPPD